MHAINKYFLWGTALLTILIVSGGSAISQNNSPVVTIMIDINAPPSPTSEEKQIAFDSITSLTNGVNPKGLNVTLFPTGDAILSQRLHITFLANASNYEVAMGGMKKDEKLGLMSPTDQRSNLSRMKQYVQACHICGGKAIAPSGLKPQLFNQSKDTYQILNDMGMLYDAGFQAGVVYLPGHKNDVWPYRIDNMNLYAVPVSTYNHSGEQILLSDRVARDEKKLSGSKWYDILAGKFNESIANGGPTVVIFDNDISGRDPAYLDAYLKFINYALSKQAIFATTSQLIGISKGGKTSSAPSNGKTSTSGAPKSICPDCDTLKNATTINTTGNATGQNKTVPADIVVNIKPNFEG